MAKRRDKKTCFRCRAFKIKDGEIKCMLGFILEDRPLEFWRAAAGQRCPKPLTINALIAAQKMGGGKR